MRKQLATLAAAVTVLTAACSRDLTAPADAARPVDGIPAASNAAVVESFTESFDDINVCTGNIVTYTFVGTSRIEQHGDLRVVIGSGTVTTSDGFSGSYNRTFMYKGDDIRTLRYHDIEVSNDGGQRQIFSMGMYHRTLVDGTTRVDFEHYGTWRCVTR